MLKGIAEKIGAGALPGGMGSPFGQMGPGMPPMGIWQPRPWMAMLEEELNPLPPYRIPPYLPAVGPSPTIYGTTLYVCFQFCDPHHKLKICTVNFFGY